MNHRDNAFVTIGFESVSSRSEYYSSTIPNVQAKPCLDSAKLLRLCFCFDSPTHRAAAAAAALFTPSPPLSLRTYSLVSQTRLKVEKSGTFFRLGVRSHSRKEVFELRN